MAGGTEKTSLHMAAAAATGASRGLQQLEAAEGGRYGSESNRSFPVSQVRSPELLRFCNQTSGAREPKPLHDPSQQLGPPQAPNNRKTHPQAC